MSAGGFNIRYQTSEGVKFYCQQWTDWATAKRTLKEFAELYLNVDGEGKMYPNHLGYYDITNAWIVYNNGRELIRCSSCAPEAR